MRKGRRQLSVIPASALRAGLLTALLVAAGVLPTTAMPPTYMVDHRCITEPGNLLSARHWGTMREVRTHLNWFKKYVCLDRNLVVESLVRVG
jgi:hypothetical protein